MTLTNTHALWDPTWARAQINSRYQAQIELGQELTRYGADLLLRALQSAPDEVPYHIILSVLFRQSVAALDATLVCLEQGAVAAANVHIRAALEARWGIEYALRDPVKWGSHLYVTSLREQRLWAARLVPGTQDYDSYAQGRAMLGPLGLPDSVREAELATYIDAVDAILSRPNYDAINAMYAAAAKGGREQQWYFDGKSPKSDQVTSIAKLAKSVGALGEYQTIYKNASYYVHGSFSGSHVSLDANGAALQHIRTIEEWRQSYVLAISIAADVYRRVIDAFRAGELAQYVKHYVERWREVIQATPEVVVVLDRLANR